MAAGTFLDAAVGLADLAAEDFFGEEEGFETDFAEDLETGLEAALAAGFGAAADAGRDFGLEGDWAAGLAGLEGTFFAAAGFGAGLREGDAAAFPPVGLDAGFLEEGADFTMGFAGCFFAATAGFPLFFGVEEEEDFTEAGFFAFDVMGSTILA